MPSPARLARTAAALVVATTALCSSPLARADGIATACPRVASHVGRIDGSAVLWESSFFDLTADPAKGAPRYERLDLARPVPGDLDASSPEGVTAVRDAGGALVAFTLDTSRLASWPGSVTVAIRAPLVHDGVDILLSPPLARGSGVERIEVSGDGDLRFEPDPTAGWLHHVGSWSTAHVSEAMRHAVDDRLGGRPPFMEAPPLYVESSSSALERGLHGRALTTTERTHTGRILAVALFVLLVAATAAGYRKLARDAQVEEAERTLREEFDDLPRQT